MIESKCSLLFIWYHRILFFYRKEKNLYSYSADIDNVFNIVFLEPPLNTIFKKNVSIDAKITTDEWKGYKQLAKEYDITQIPSKNGINFKA